MPATFQKTLLITGVAAAMLAAKAPALGSSSRGDVPASFSTAVCNGQITALPLAAWKLGVFDAQLDGRFITRVGNLPVSLEALEAKAKSLAEMRNTGGYAFGLCPERTRGWVMALPAPAPLQREGTSSLLLPRAALMARCSSFQVDFAANSGGPPRPVRTRHGHLSLSGLRDGTLSLTCQPKAPRWQGPVLWFLYPVGDAPASQPPAADIVAGAHDPKRLLFWVNKVREAERLPPLAPNATLDATANNLVADESLSHNRTLLQSAAKDLQDRRIDMLAEDRVKAADVSTMAWLLWHSPRHRAALLNSQASVLGIGFRSTGDEQLAVLVTGAASSVSTARKAPVAGPGLF